MSPETSLSPAATGDSGPEARLKNAAGQRISRVATWLVLAHLAVGLTHGLAHSHLAIGINLWQKIFVAIVINAGPLAAVALLWTRLQKPGALLLASTMAASLIFGVYYHFLAAGPDNALGQGPGSWNMAFLATSVLLALTEAFAMAWSWWAFRSIKRTD